MNILNAKHKLSELSEQNIREEYENLSKDEYKFIFYSIRNHIPFKDKILNIAVKKFLYYGSIKFNKFSIPSSIVSTEDDFINFKLFLSALWGMEGKESGNAPTQEIHKLKWEIYNRFNFKKIKEDDSVELNKYLNRLNLLSIPDFYKEKIVEFDEQKQKLSLLILGMLSNTLLTKIKTRLPYKFSNKRTFISFEMDDVNVEVEIIPHYLGCNDSFLQVDLNSTMESSGASRWQNFISEINITLKGLVDDSRSVPSLMLIASKDDDCIDENWNYLFDITYRIIENLWWHFKKNNIVTSNWTPAPKDIPFIEFSQWNRETQIEFKLMSNPSNVYHIGNNNVEFEKYNIKYLKEVKWNTKSYLYAQIYSEIGQYKEALFWLNVATESLIDDFINSVITDEKLLSELSGNVSSFESAESILSQQFPEMKGKVKWPNSTRHPSVYTKISKVIKECKFPLSEKEVLSKYSNINSERNKLFHGIPLDIQANKLKKAFDAYEWLMTKISPYLNI